MPDMNLVSTHTTLLNPGDNVAIAITPLRAGQSVRVGDRLLRLLGDIPVGHKLALYDIPAGELVRRYGQTIGAASRPVQAGEHVHSHNLHLAHLERDFAQRDDVGPLPPARAEERRIFAGYRRTDGRSGTRNIIAVATTVNCSAHTARRLAARARAELLPRFPGVDNIVALTHGGGCGTRGGSPELHVLQRTTAGHVRHPNVAGALVIGLGCEVNQFEDLLAQQVPDGSRPRFLSIQEAGGVESTVSEGLELLVPLLEEANLHRREDVPASELVLALQCGGSDGFSGITANPALGLVADWLVAQGGTVVLAETPEIYGAEHLLTRRAAEPGVAEKLLERIRWWEEYASRHGFELDNNPTPGNKAGGLTTIYEKSLGAIAKAGSSPLRGVCAYAEPLHTRGFIFMDSPGYDPVSVTGQVASGCNLVAFTTGRGSCYGNAISPSIKISSNTETYRRMSADMDINAGAALEGKTLSQIANEIVGLLLEVASGRRSKSEAQGIGEEEFSPWILGATL